MADHDGLYRRLFDHPDMVAQLFHEFRRRPLARRPRSRWHDARNAAFHAATGDRREGDMVWRIPRRDGGDTYLLLLLEFQSTSDRWMALRVLVYAGLLWQHLVNEKRLPPDGRLPPILPVVLYNGDRRWAAPLALHQLVGLSGDSPLWPCQPAMRYQIVDEGAFPEDDLAGARCAAGAAVPAGEFARSGAGRRSDRRGAGVVHGAIRGLSGCGRFLSICWAPSWRRWRRGFGCRTSCWRSGTCWRHARKPGSSSGCGKASRRAEQRGAAGRQRGRQEGEAALLRRQLERRFGALPDWARDRIAAADTAALEEWGLRVLDAGSL